MAKSRKPSDTDLPAPSAAGDSAEPANPSPSPRASAEPPRERIAERAYELYLARGRSDGQDWEDWLVAEREVLTGGGRPPRDE